MPAPRLLFVTGRLAEPALKRLLVSLSQRVGFEYEVAVLGISVAALMNVDFILRKLTVPEGTERVILPGWTLGDIRRLTERYQVPFERGPKDLHDLPDYFGTKKTRPEDYGRYDIEILGEINHAPRMPVDDLFRMAERFRADGADVIDLGCIPGEPWEAAGAVTAELRRRGFRVSIDSFEQSEVTAAVQGGAELVLSCNTANRDWAAKLAVEHDAELVVVPDDPHTLAGLDDTIDFLRQRGVKFRLDPILEPIGFGFAASLGRYLDVRKRYPECAMMMGIGNLTELSEADSSGINLLLAGFCQEQRIHSVLTTQVINWCRTAIKEFDIARQLARHSITQQVLPKHVDSRLVMLRDNRVNELGPDGLDELAEQIRDANYRIFVESGEIHLLNRDGHWHGTDPYELFDQLPAVDASHAFYLGYELSKAVTALTLGKHYRQDEALRWGFLTIPERSAHERRKADRQSTGQEQS